MRRSTNIVIFFLSIAFFLMASMHFVNYAPDDIFISLNYAQHLGQGHGLEINPGEKVEGFSNLLWVLYLSLFVNFTSTFGMTLVAKASGVFFGAFTLVAVGMIARRFPASEKAGDHWSLAPLGFSLFVYPAFWSASGMETGFYLFLFSLATLSFFLFVEKKGYISAGISALIFLFVALTRPEGAIFFACALAVLVVHSAKQKSRLSLSFQLWFWMFFVGLFSLFFWRLGYFGQFWPNTFYAKAQGGLEKYAQGVRYLLLAGPALFWSNPLVAVLLALPFAYSKRIGRYSLFLILCILAQISFAVYAGGDWMPGARFLVPAMIPVALLLPSAARELSERFSGAFSVGIRIALGLLVVFGLFLHLYNAKQISHRPSGLQYYDGQRFFMHDHFAVAQWLKKNAEPEQWIATGESGLIPYLTGMRLVDLFGLMDPYLARLPGLRHEKFDADYAFKRAPDFIILGGCKIWNDTATSDFEYARVLLADKRLEKRYEKALTHHTFLVFKKK